MAIFYLNPVPNTEAHPKYFLWERNLPKDQVPQIVYSYTEKEARECLSRELERNHAIQNPKAKFVQIIHPNSNTPTASSERAWHHPELVTCTDVTNSSKGKEFVESHQEWQQKNPNPENSQSEIAKKD